MDVIGRISQILKGFFSSSEMIVAFIVSVLFFTIVYYYFMKFLFDNNSGALVLIFIASMLIFAILVMIVSSMDSSIFMLVPLTFLVVTIILYSVEIKRIIWAKTNLKNEVKHSEHLSYDNEKIARCINEIIKALQNMSKNDIGAILILSNGNVPTQIIDSGIRLESDISSELIESVFFPKTPLHDGAMIINDMKIEAAGCFLPLSQNLDRIPKGLGTRHRAGIGVTETIDVVSIIVSEETGIISVAKAGKITRYADTEMLKKTLSKYYWQGQIGGRR